MKLSEMSVEQLEKKLARIKKILAAKKPGGAGGLSYSNKLEELLERYPDLTDEVAPADSSCTSGYDNDGSTGFEIFENGFQLGEAAEGAIVFYCNDGDCCHFFIAGPGEDEDAFVKRLEDAAKAGGLAEEEASEEEA
jgi:hypothetical protein